MPGSVVAPLAIPTDSDAKKLTSVTKQFFSCRNFFLQQDFFLISRKKSDANFKKSCGN